MTSNDTDSKGRPPEPREPERSNDKKSQAPITDEAIIVTTGTEGLDGRDTTTLTEELFCQPTQGTTFDNNTHFALIRDSLNLRASPTFNKPTETEDRDVAETGYNKNLSSSTHTQRVEEVRDVDSTTETHGNSFENPPRFVGESNSTSTLPPSRENVADFIIGGGGSESGPNTRNLLPRGYSITYRPFKL